MIFLYTVVLTLLGLLKVVVTRRAASLERKYMKVAGETTRLAHEANTKPGNAGAPRNDIWMQTAKRQFELGLLVTRRDRLEAKQFFWQNLSDRLTRAVASVRLWQGRKLPYTMGVVDVWLVLSAIDYLGVGQIVSAQRILEALTEYFAQ